MNPTQPSPIYSAALTVVETAKPAVQMTDALKEISDCADAIGPAFFVAVAFLLGLAIGYHAGFKDGAEGKNFLGSDSGNARQEASEIVRQD